MDLRAEDARGEGGGSSTIRARGDANVRDAGRAPGAQHGETRLHQEDEDAAVEEPVDVGAGRDRVVARVRDERGDLRELVV